MPSGGRPCAVNSAAASAGGVSGSANDSGTLSMPSLITVSSIAPTLRRNGGDRGASTRRRPHGAAQRRADAGDADPRRRSRSPFAAHQPKMSAVMPEYQPMFSCLGLLAQLGAFAGLGDEGLTAAILPSFAS